MMLTLSICVRSLMVCFSLDRFYLFKVNQGVVLQLEFDDDIHFDVFLAMAGISQLVSGVFSLEMSPDTTR